MSDIDEGNASDASGPSSSTYHSFVDGPIRFLPVDLTRVPTYKPIPTEERPWIKDSLEQQDDNGKPVQAFLLTRHASEWCLRAIINHKPEDNGSSAREVVFRIEDDGWDRGILCITLGEHKPVKHEIQEIQEEELMWRKAEIMPQEQKQRSENALSTEPERKWTWKTESLIEDEMRPVSAYVPIRVSSNNMMTVKKLKDFVTKIYTGYYVLNEGAGRLSIFLEILRKLAEGSERGSYLAQGPAAMDDLKYAVAAPFSKSGVSMIKGKFVSR